MIALIDADVIAYLACESRFKKDENGKWQIDLHNVNKEIEYTPEENARYLKKCWENFKKILTETCEAVYAEDYLAAVKGVDNFRNFMYPEYKLNRHAESKATNEFVPVIRQLAVKEELAIPADGREADDLLKIWAYECIKLGKEYIVCSIDKDLKCIPGKHFNLKRREFEEISEIEAIRFQYEQLLKGDPTDNIPGIPKVGEVKARKALAVYNTEEEFQDVVVEMYMESYGDSWLDYLLSNGKMLYLQQHANDYFSVENWPLVKAFREVQKENGRCENIENTITTT